VCDLEKNLKNEKAMTRVGSQCHSKKISKAEDDDDDKRGDNDDDGNLYFNWKDNYDDE
jgi:hypothetical protein